MATLSKALNKKWLVLEKTTDHLIDQLLINRAIAKEDWENFLHPDFNRDLHDPFLLPDMKKAVERLNLALQKKEKIGIFADYDADGIPGAALLNDIFTKLNLETIVYIPSRKEGYGLNKNGIDYLLSEKVNLIITVDLGTRDFEEAEYLKTKKIDLIITDHHEPDKQLPDAYAIINPKIAASIYPFKELSGGGVAFKLAQALAKETQKISGNDLKWLMDLVSITTICDMVPLIGENRVFTKFGLIVLPKTKRIGLNKLYEVAAIDKTKINSYTIGFQIGPCLNAPGRLDHTTQSYELLVSQNSSEAKALAQKIDQINFTRQAKLEEILQDAEEKINKNKLYNKKIICLRNAAWPSGLIGLVAGKIMEKYHRPSIIFEKGEIYSKGSARSTDQFNIISALDSVQDLLVNFGGHAKAAGLTIENTKFDDFCQRIQKLADEKINQDDLTPKIIIDAELKTKEINLKTYKEIEKLEPFGLANPRPVFCLKNIRINEIKLVGSEGKHLKFKIEGIDAIAFSFGWLIERLGKNNLVDIAFTMDNNVWRGFEKIQLKIIDLKQNNE